MSLLKINKRLKVVSLPSDCESSVAEMHGAATLEALEAKYRDLLGRWPRYEPILKKEYRKRIKAL